MLRMRVKEDSNIMWKRWKEGREGREWREGMEYSNNHDSIHQVCPRCLQPTHT